MNLGLAGVRDFGRFASLAAVGRIKTRMTAFGIFSRRDGVVAWQACIDQINQSVEHVEVKSSHLGLGFDPEVYRLIARRLAKNETTDNQ